MYSILKTINGLKTDNVPIWIMRQAGRYLPEYMKIRNCFESFVDFCLTPEAAVEVTLQPLRRFDLDAAIIFSDILILPKALGVNVEFKKGSGPILSKIRNADQLKIVPGILENVYEAISNTKNILEKEFRDKALIGFVGAPWTVACYLVEGSGSKDFSEVRKFVYSNKSDFSEIIDVLVEETSKHLINQIKAGADIVKIFDSWAGFLNNELFEEFVINPTTKIVNNVRKEFKDIPIIGFPKGAGVLYPEYAFKTGVNCLAVDQFIDISWVKKNLRNKVVLQGNLDNALLFGSKKDIETATKKILDNFHDIPFIFNLGHGILPNTPIENVSHLVNFIKSNSK